MTKCMKNYDKQLGKATAILPSNSNSPVKGTGVTICSEPVVAAQGRGLTAQSLSVLKRLLRAASC